MKLNWELLYNDSSDYFPRLLEFGEISDSRFRYGINELMQHCLYFYFPANDSNRPIEPLNMTNVSFHEASAKGKPALVLTLLNNSLEMLFDDLIISLVVEINDQADKAGKKDFIILCNKWFELFDPLPASLTIAELQGIFAEVCFLQYLLTRSESHFNFILRSWLGPYNKGHDFELGDNHYEIKSRQEGNQLVNISSEYQLDYLGSQRLTLSVYAFRDSNDDGITIGQLISVTADILRSRPDTQMNIFWTALGRLKLGFNVLDNYNGHLFAIKSVTHYNCNAEGFPSIRRSRIPDAQREIKYKLALNELMPFEQADIEPYI